MKVAIVMGTRPEIIKLAPIIKKLGTKKCSVIFTGQHFDYQMGMQFIHQLELPKPNYSLKISKTNPSLQISEIIAKLSKIFSKENPDTVIVQGDTNTVLAAGICSIKSGIPISHVEAGLRSHDWRMPEEHNRIVIDHLSELLFTPTQNSRINLISEKVHGQIHVTGNTIIDAINMYSKISKKKSSLSIDVNEYVLLTLHRSENVDNKKILSSIVKGIIDSNENIIFPVHPRTKKRLHEFNLYNKLSKSKNILLMNPLGYFEMLELMKKCSFIVTDSGGVQEEATSPIIRKKVLVVRKTTDRPEAVESKMAKIIGLTEKSISSSIKKTMKNPELSSRKTPYGKGNASSKIIEILQKRF
jgi:UDP-N-acetylglucosamine 2-epimerase (non-hydrolysing)